MLTQAFRQVSLPSLYNDSFLHLQNGESFAKYLQMPASKPTHLTFVVKKCKELAVASINSTSSKSPADNFFSSIQILLQQDQDLQQSAFYCACASAAVQVAETAQAKGIWCWDRASNLVQDLCAQIQPHWAHMSAFSAVNLLQALVKCHLQHGGIPQDCLKFAIAMVSEASHQLTQQGVSLAAWACAHLYQRHNPTKYYPLLDKLAARALLFKQSDATKLQHISTIIWSMARSQYLPSEEVLLNLTEAACVQIHDALPHAAQDIEMMFLGYAWLGYPPPPQARQTFVQTFLHQRLRGYQASNVAWSLAVLGTLDMPTFRSLLSHITQRDLGDTKISGQLHHAAEFLRPSKAATEAASEEWHQLMEKLRQSWPEQPPSRKQTRRIHADVLAVLREGLGLECRQDVPIAREHDQSLFSMDILIERQPGIPFDIAVEVDGPDAFIHNRPVGDR